MNKPKTSDNFNEMSKEQLIAILTAQKQQQSVPAQKTASPQKAVQPPEPKFESSCKFIPVRGNSAKCADQVITPFGFCKKHSRTIQAIRAKEEYENQLHIEAVPDGSEESHETEVVEKSEVKPEPVKPEPVVVAAAVSAAKSFPPVKEEKKSQRKEPVKETAREHKREEKAPTKAVVEKKIEKKEDTVPVVKREEKSQSKKVENAKPEKKNKDTEGEKQPSMKRRVIKPNYWRRYEDLETHIVFDPQTKQAYGVQESTGKVSPLKQQHIDICKRYGWHYNLPYDSEEDDEDEESIHDDDFDESSESVDKSDEEESEDEEEESEDEEEEESEDEEDEEEEEDESDEEEEESEDDDDSEDDDSDDSEEESDSD